MKFTVELWLDGYDTEEEMEKACVDFIHDQLSFAGSSVEVTPYGGEVLTVVEGYASALMPTVSWRRVKWDAGTGGKKILLDVAQKRNVTWYPTPVTVTVRRRKGE